MTENVGEWRYAVKLANTRALTLCLENEQNSHELILSGVEHDFRFNKKKL